MLMYFPKINFRCSLWLRYGFLTAEKIVIIVNLVGSLLMLVYVGIYYVFTVNKKTYMRQFAVTVLFLITAVLYTKYEEDRGKASKIMGKY